MAAQFLADYMRSAWDFTRGARVSLGGWYQTVTSQKVQKGALTAVLILIATGFLYACAIFAYVALYNIYLPTKVATVPLHLQYGYADNPFAITSLRDANLKDVQPYDITVTLDLPRSPSNVARGNFMVALYLLDSAPRSSQQVKAASSGSLPALPFTRPNPVDLLAGRTVLFSTMRPALMPYADPLVTTASRVMLLLFYVAFPREAETAKVEVVMAEKVEFLRSGLTGGKGLPAEVLVELQAGQDIQVYGAKVTLTARLSGLRWAMYHHRVLSFLVLTSVFWILEMAGLLLTFFILQSFLDDYLSKGHDNTSKGAVILGGPKEKETIKNNPDMSDTERTFPSTSKQPPLKYEPRIKSEDPFDSGEAEPAVPDVPVAAEADDEDEGLEELDMMRDSGIGTSYSDHPSKETVRRRTSGGS